jgi:nitrogen-specific signal transduction histidine kinase
VSPKIPLLFLVLDSDVEDNGEGIPESIRGKLFTPLVTTKSRGQVFGLSVVKRFTEGMAERLHLKVKLGKEQNS